MIYKIIVWLNFILFATNPIFCQNKNSIWIFGDSAGIDFRAVSNPIPINSGMDGRGSCASIADSLGNLLFSAYTNVSFARTTILNSNNDTMANSDPMPGNGSYNELVIIPKPGSNSKHYLFYIGVPGFVDTVYYAAIDMNANGGLGAATQINIPLDAYSPADCLTGVQHGNGRDWWVITKYYNASTSFNRFHVYLVTPDSISSPNIQDINDAIDGYWKKIIWHPGYNKFILTNLDGYMSEFNFDRCSGNITLSRVLFLPQSSNYNRLFWEGAFAPNGDILYVSTTAFPGITDSAYLLQINLLDSVPLNSIDTLDVFQFPIGTGAVRRGPDDKIYFSRAYESVPGYPYPDSVRNIFNENLSVINQPDQLGSACDYQPFSFYLGGKRTYYGLPNNPSYSLGPLAGSPCDTLYLSTGEKENRPTVLLNPNPANSVIYLNAQHLAGKHATLQITNSLGQELLKKTVEVFNGDYTRHVLPNTADRKRDYQQKIY